ncbi:MAG TPA: hypothetical protein O0X70_04025 [Methanocorpusculum sp.]|nr:hypothetical protein [Methanocorpusculum sp.]
MIVLLSKVSYSFEINEYMVIMHIDTNRYTPFEPAANLPDFEKLLRQKLSSGAVAIFTRTGVTPAYCGLRDPEEFCGKILFINPHFFKPAVYFTEAQENILKAIGYLASENTDEASALFYKYCIEEPVRLADMIWDAQKRFDQNFFGRALVEGGAQWTLQSEFPDMNFLKKLVRYINRNMKKVRGDAKFFAAQKDMKTYRASIFGSLLTALSDDEYKEAFAQSRDELLASYKNLKEYIAEMMEVPKLFGCTKYLLRGGEYRDIAGICRLVEVSEIAEHGFVLHPAEYV